jgi:hypothetical protein
LPVIYTPQPRLCYCCGSIRPALGACNECDGRGPAWSICSACLHTYLGTHNQMPWPLEREYYAKLKYVRSSNAKLKARGMPEHSMEAVRRCLIQTSQLISHAASRAKSLIAKRLPLPLPHQLQQYFVFQAVLRLPDRDPPSLSIRRREPTLRLARTLIETSVTTSVWAIRLKIAPAEPTQ